MKLTGTRPPGARVIQPDVVTDDRGWFSRPGRSGATQSGDRGLFSVYPAWMRKLLLTAALSITAVAGCSKPDKTPSAPAAAAPAADKAEDKLPSMTVDEVDRALAANQAKAVDCNGEDLRKKMGVVPSAILVTDDESYAASELPADKTTKLVFYCADPG